MDSKHFWAATALAVLLSAVASAAEKAAAPQLQSFRQKASYALGLKLGADLKCIKGDLDPALVAKGMADVFADAKPVLTEVEAAGMQRTLFQKLRVERMRAQEALAERGRKESEAFLAANKKKPGVVTTKSGLQYQVIRKGDGPKPKLTDKVKVHYFGKLVDGTEFGSSYKRGAPITLPVTGIIRGWTEALQLMSVGSKYKIFVPSDLGYGPRGAPPRIGPNAALVFEVELLGIEKQSDVPSAMKQRPAPPKHAMPTTRHRAAPKPKTN